ncbi:YciI family protein [Magnetospira thiophila]
MLFAIICKDKPQSLDLRMANREAHLAYAADWNSKMLIGGPLLAEDGTTMIGSMLVLDVDSRDDAQRFVDGDPYGQAGLFQSVEIHGYKKVFPR